MLNIFISKVLSKKKLPIQSRADAQDFILSLLNCSGFQEMKCKPAHQTLHFYAHLRVYSTTLFRGEFFIMFWAV